LYKKDRPDLTKNISSQNAKDLQSLSFKSSLSSNPKDSAAARPILIQNDSNPLEANENMQSDETLSHSENPQNPENDFDNAFVEEAWNKRKP